jgi:class 3 adenylate cyclase
LLNTGTSLKRQRMTVVCVNLVGFNAAAAAAGPMMVVSAMDAAVERVLRHVADCRGVLDSFHGDRFLATFNAAAPCTAHSRRAAACALRCAAELPTLGLRLAATAGVASGEALVGNVGAKAMKHFCAIGPAVSQAAVLERLAKAYPDAATRVVVSARVAADTAAQIRVRPLDVVALPGRARGQTVFEATGEVDADGAGQNDEWLYIVGADGDAADQHPSAVGQPSSGGASVAAQSSLELRRAAAALVGAFQEASAVEPDFGSLLGACDRIDTDLEKIDEVDATSMASLAGATRVSLARLRAYLGATHMQQPAAAAAAGRDSRGPAAKAAPVGPSAAYWLACVSPGIAPA